MSMSGYNVRVTGADVYGEGSQVVVKLTFTGDMTGTGYLKGTPSYDAATHTLNFPDLDYTLETNDALLKTANWFAQGEVRDRLRERFTIDMSQPIENMKQGLEKVLNQRRGNVQLQGTVQELKLIGVYRLPNGDIFTAFLEAKGKMSAEVDHSEWVSVSVSRV